MVLELKFGAAAKKLQLQATSKAQKQALQAAARRVRVSYVWPDGARVTDDAKAQNK
jgi:hypothetical protein